MFASADVQFVQQVDLTRDHGALRQALVYTANDLLNCLARRGIVENEVQFMVLSGRKRGTEEQRFFYVRACLRIPRLCGGRFTYSVLDFGRYNDERVEESALAAYLHVLSDGIKRAQRVTDAMAMATTRETTRETAPTPLCGRTPRVANLELPGLELVGSPTLVPN